MQLRCCCTICSTGGTSLATGSSGCRGNLLHTLFARSAIAKVAHEKFCACITMKNNIKVHMYQLHLYVKLSCRLRICRLFNFINDSCFFLYHLVREWRKGGLVIIPLWISNTKFSKFLPLIKIDLGSGPYGFWLSRQLNARPAVIKGRQWSMRYGNGYMRPPANSTVIHLIRRLH